MARAIDTRYTVRRRAARQVARVPFGDIAHRILGARYELSLVFIGDALARRLNREYRGKTYAANVLTFPLADDAGEIFINLRAAEREARALNITTADRLAHLFIHGCLHLAGIGHGHVMDKKEAKLVRAFGFELSTHNAL